MNCVYSGGFDLIVSDQVWNDGVKTLINSGNHANMHSVTIIIIELAFLGLVWMLIQSPKLVFQL